jgi:hypothetical protein
MQLLFVSFSFTVSVGKEILFSSRITSCGENRNATSYFFTDDIKPLELETTETNTDNLIIFLLRGQTQDQCSSVANNDASNIPYESNPLLCRNISEL